MKWGELFLLILFVAVLAWVIVVNTCQDQVTEFLVDTLYSGV